MDAVEGIFYTDMKIFKNRLKINGNTVRFSKKNTFSNGHF